MNLGGWRHCVCNMESNLVWRGLSLEGGNDSVYIVFVFTLVYILIGFFRMARFHLEVALIICFLYLHEAPRYYTNSSATVSRVRVTRTGDYSKT